MALKWVKSSYSSGTGGQCVEVARIPGVVAVRDSKDPSGPILRFTADEWKRLTELLKSGR
jgi:Domain of unknown function (DUF397)